MFEQLQDRFGTILRNLRGRGRITEKNISETGREIRRVLLEADVNIEVARDFVQEVVRKARGSPVLKSVTPGQQFVKIIHSELTALLGQEAEFLRYGSSPPAVILMAGLQGSGKTTTAAKLAARIVSEGKRPYLVAGDVYRPAAVEQLKILGKQTGVPVWSGDHRDPVKICSMGIENAVEQGCDVVILDTAGRLHVDSEMMDEIIEIARTTHPDEILFVVDGMTGQDAVNSARVFSEALNITGTILTKMDGDARGGAAVSIRAVTGRPIKFIGTSERMDGLEVFHPERMAARILGMGDVVTLVEKAQKVTGEEQAQKMVRKLRERDFTLDDLQVHLRQVRKMGPVGELLAMIPGAGKLTRGLDFDEMQLVWTDAIINSMTPEERRDPSIINGSRRKRIARGSGTSVQQVNTLLKEFHHMEKTMKGFARTDPGRGILGQFTRMVK